MHDIEPYFKWRDKYIASEDIHSPFYGCTYSEFEFSNKIYNYYIHPQWDSMGSPTLYLKVLYVHYTEQFCVIELIGEWNDCLHNDIMYFKREVIDRLIKLGIRKFIILCDHVLNYHCDDDSYYEEWYDDIKDDDGWICFVNTRDHVLREMNSIYLQHYIRLGEEYNNWLWQQLKPLAILHEIEDDF